MRYKQIDMLEFNQNTIDDFYETTKDMIDDLLELTCTKLADFLQEGKFYTKSSVLEKLGSAIRYVKTFAYGYDFQGEH